MICVCFVEGSTGRDKSIGTSSHHGGEESHRDDGETDLQEAAGRGDCQARQQLQSQHTQTACLEAGTQGDSTAIEVCVEDLGGLQLPRPETVLHVEQ